jgi:hypothetical protein
MSAETAARGATDLLGADRRGFQNFYCGSDCPVHFVPDVELSESELSKFHAKKIVRIQTTRSWLIPSDTDSDVPLGFKAKKNVKRSGNEYFDFHSAELAPPQGNHAQRYFEASTDMMIGWRKGIRLQKIYYDRRHGPIKPIEAGDFVLIRLDQHLVALIKRMKLTQQKLPPYRVLEVLAKKHAVKLDIPPHIGIHPVISIQHVERTVDPSKDPFERSNSEEPEAVDPAGDCWEGEIVDEKTSRSGQKSYLVHWIGWSDKYDECLFKPGRMDHGMTEDD